MGTAAFPKVFITDNTTETINALHNVWPSALHILCKWHTWNAVWHFCNNGNNRIKNLIENHFQVRYYDCLFRRMAYADSNPTVQKTSIIWRENVLTDQKSLQKVLGWRIICPYIGSSYHVKFTSREPYELSSSHSCSSNSTTYFRCHSAVCLNLKLAADLLLTPCFQCETSY